MTLVISTFIWLLAAVASILLAQVFHKISVNYLSMLMGFVIFLVPVIHHNVVNFNSEIFMGMIVAPLLFFEGQATRLNIVGKQLHRIFQMTVSLVIISLIVVGFGSWWLGGISLPLAFMLAAISTPTDATAMQSVTNGLVIPEREGTYLRMESLFNDASGIILLNMAALWYVNGYINYGETLLDFVISAGGGALFGFVFASIIVLWRQQLLRSSYNSQNAQILLYIVTPFVLYYLSELIHVSGIIAVVCAGLVHNAEAQRNRLINAPQAHLGTDMVSMITEIFNSAVFVILGFLFISIVSDRAMMGHSWRWLILGIGLYVMNVIVRYVYSRMRLGMARHEAIIFSLGGVHGAVTLALAYTVAELHVAGNDFHLILLSECVLIILSMVVPTIVFRFMLKPSASNRSLLKEGQQIRTEMVGDAIAAVSKMYLPARVKQSVIFDLNTQKQATRTRDFVHAWFEVVRHPEFTGAEKELEMRAFMNAFLQERQYLDEISQSEVKYQSCVYQLYNEVLLAESLVVGPNVYDTNEGTNGN